MFEGVPFFGDADHQAGEGSGDFGGSGGLGEGKQVTSAGCDPGWQMDAGFASRVNSGDLVSQRFRFRPAARTYSCWRERLPNLAGHKKSHS